MRASSRQKQNTSSWLTTRHFLKTLDEDYIDNHLGFIKDIIRLLYGSWKGLINHLIDFADDVQRASIQTILKKENAKYNDEEIMMMILNENNNSAPKQQPIAYFDHLSIESIANICSFLNKSDINHFKLTSALIAAQCLEEMKRYSLISELGVNHFISKHKHLSSKLVFDQSSFSRPRYDKYVIKDSIKLINIWSHRYAIAKNNLLILYNYDSKKQMHPMTRFDISEFIIVGNLKSNFLFPTGTTKLMGTYRILLFDKRQILVIDKRNKLKGKPHEIAANYFIILLYFFNKKHQYTEYNQTLMIPKNFSLDELEQFIGHNIHLFAANICTASHKNEFMRDFEQYKAIEITKQMTTKRNIDGHFVGIFALNHAEYHQKCKSHCDTLKKIQFCERPKELMQARQPHIGNGLKKEKVDVVNVIVREGNIIRISIKIIAHKLRPMNVTFDFDQSVDSSSNVAKEMVEDINLSQRMVLPITKAIDIVLHQFK